MSLSATMLPVRIELLAPDAKRPSRATPRSAGYDVYAHLAGRTVEVFRRP